MIGTKRTPILRQRLLSSCSENRKFDRFASAFTSRIRGENRPGAFYFHGAGRVKDRWVTERSEQRERKSKDLGQLLRSLARSVAGGASGAAVACFCNRRDARVRVQRELASQVGSIFSMNFELRSQAVIEGARSGR